MPKNQLIFTRLLYPKDEVVFSIWYCFENKTSYDETLYWCYELYMSGFEEETMQILFTMYFCYISFHNQGIITELNKIYLDWKNETEHKEKSKYVHVFLSKIYNEKYSNLVYNFIQKYKEMTKVEKITLYKGKKPKWLEEYDESVRTFIHSVSKQNVKNTYHFLKIKEDKSTLELEKLELAVKQYMKNHNYEYVYSENLQSKLIIILSNLFTMLTDCHTEQTKNNTVHFDSINEDIKLDDFITNFNEYYPSKIYKILREQRKYKTHTEKMNESEMSINKINKTWQQCYYDDWLYHASFSPLWEKRIQEYDGLIDHTNQKVVLDDSEIYQNDNTRFEEFYNHYNLEPDEQPGNVLN